MTFVGHTLMGITIGVVAKPRNTSRRWSIIYFIVFGLLANIPDLPFPNWGHDRYKISHSIFVTSLLICLILVGLFLWHRIWHKIKNRSVVIAGAFAWLSHLLLDSFYNHGRGIAIFWPFSNARLILPIPWFSVLPSIPPPFTWHIIQIFLIEFISYFSLLLLVFVLRRMHIFKWFY